MEKSDILKKIDRRDGMTVPEGYFADFAKRMAESLPERKVSPMAEPQRTTWQRLRPYAYMAAMFAGIWCMLRMFTMMGGGSADLSIDNYPGVVTALNDDRFINDYLMNGLDEYDILDDLYEQDDITPDEFFDFNSEEDTETNRMNLHLPSDTIDL